MSIMDNGGQAFPGPSFTSNGMPNGHDMGMTLRDWFAGQALPGIIAQPNLEGHNPAVVAKWAYEYADAMLAARP